MKTVRVQPTFSILTTAYRTEAYIAAAIESVLAQTRTDWELIVVDNGLSDEMAWIVSSYIADPRITFVRQENRGVGGGVEAAADIARGRFFTVLHSDDLLMPDFCDRIGAVLDSDPRVDAVGCDAYLFDDADGSTIGTHQRSLGFTKRPTPRHRMTLTEALAGRIPYYSGAVRREAWLAAGGYQPAAPQVEEDVMLWLHLLGAGYDVRMVPDRLGRFRRRSDSLSHDPRSVDDFEERLANTFVVAARLSGERQDLDALEGTLRRLRYYAHLRRARCAVLAGDVGAARTAARKAFGQHHTVRAASIVASLALAPGTLRRIHPAKQRVTATVQRAGSLLPGRIR